MFLKFFTPTFTLVTLITYYINELRFNWGRKLRSIFVKLTFFVFLMNL